VAKSSGKGEWDDKVRSRPPLYGKRAGKDHVTAKYIEEKEQATSDREAENFVSSI
jgi:hypothetical protein